MHRRRTRAYDRKDETFFRSLIADFRILNIFTLDGMDGNELLSYISCPLFFILILV